MKYWMMAVVACSAQMLEKIRNANKQIESQR